MLWAALVLPCLQWPRCRRCRPQVLRGMVGECGCRCVPSGSVLASWVLTSCAGAYARACFSSRPLLAEALHRFVQLQNGMCSLNLRYQQHCNQPNEPMCTLIHWPCTIA